MNFRSPHGMKNELKKLIFCSLKNPISISTR